MSEEDLQKLAKLSKREREVLWLVCEGNSQDDISKKLFISIPTVKNNMGRVYVKLGLDQMNQAERVKAIHQIYCPLMRNSELPPEEAEPQKPEPVPEPVSRMVDEDEYAIIPYRPEPKDILVINTRQPSPRRTGWLRLVFGLLGIVLVGLIAYFLISNYLNHETSQAALELTRVVAQLTQVASAPSLEPPQTVVVPTSMPIAQVFTPIPTSNLPATPTTPPPAPAPTNPPPTPAPTLTLGPVISLPFSDNFDNGPSSQWQVFSGNWITANGKYTSTEYDNGWALSALDDPGWKNYRIQVNVNFQHMYSGAQGQAGVMVRISSGQSKYLGFTIDGLARGYWSLVTVDDSYPVPIAGYASDFQAPPQFLLDIEVRGNQFVARVNGQQIQSLSMSGYDSGGIALGVSCITSNGCPSFDNLKIDPLP